MKYAFYVPNFGYCGDAATLAELAALTEASGWDGFFIWDHVQFPGIEPAVDPWVALTAIAISTQNIKFGPMITPLPRRDIVNLARQSASVDRLSDGRLILGIGLGGEVLPEWSAFGHEEDAKTRGAMIDEGLEVLDALWSGEPVNHQGPHYKCVCDGFAKPVQEPRIPVWIAGTWPGTKPFRRAAKWDGTFVVSKTAMEGGVLSHDDVADLKNLIGAQGSTRDDYDIATHGESSGPDDNARSTDIADAGVTWWIEAGSTFSHTLDQVKERIRQGPPKI